MKQPKLQAKLSVLWAKFH